MFCRFHSYSAYSNKTQNYAMGWIGFLNCHIGPKGQDLWFKEKMSNPRDSCHKTEIYIILVTLGETVCGETEYDM